MHRPVAVFDAGIGSYAIVDALRRRLPRQDIIYLADRASFPYGGKDRDTLLGVMRRTIRFLEGMDPSAIIMASNAPSIMVLDEIRAATEVPVFGVLPPLRQALAASATGEVGIMGVRSMIESAALGDFVRAHAPDPARVALIDASPMVERVESGAFLFAPEETQTAVARFVAGIFDRHPAIDVLTLSSTHLPWLRGFFAAVRPQCRFLDPAESIVAVIGDGTEGSGRIRGLVTEGAGYGIAAFREMLAKLRVNIDLERVDIA